MLAALVNGMGVACRMRPFDPHPVVHLVRGQGDDDKAVDSVEVVLRRTAAAKEGRSLEVVDGEADHKLKEVHYEQRKTNFL
jgi:hypothetical protein